MTLLLLMFVGASAGSTGGSIKVVRHLLLFKLVRRELEHTIHREAVVPVRANGVVVDERALRSAVVFVLLYLLTFALGALGLVIDARRGGAQLTAFDAFGAAAACLGNVGPAFGFAGPYGSFEPFSDLSTVICTALMWLGRVEIVPVAVLLTRGYWRHPTSAGGYRPSASSVSGSKKCRPPVSTCTAIRSPGTARTRGGSRAVSSVVLCSSTRVTPAAACSISTSGATTWTASSSRWTSVSEPSASVSATGQHELAPRVPGLARRIQRLRPDAHDDLLAGARPAAPAAAAAARARWAPRCSTTSPASTSTRARTRFMAGDPMNAATNRLAGRS